MKELKCPHCGSLFQIDESDYASLLDQVKTTEFEAEITRRMHELAARHQAEQALADAKAEQKLQTLLSQKELELTEKNSQIKRLHDERDAALAKIVSEKDALIQQLRSQMANLDNVKQVELTQALAAKDQQIAQMQNAITQSDSRLKLALMEEQNKSQQALQQQASQIVQLQNACELQKREAQIHEDLLATQHKEELRQKQELIDYYKDLKTRMSTKMVGETLEQHCSYQFETYLRPVMPHAYFGKDNDASEGSKGDFIFRDSDDGTEYISIMFEMKNEMDTTATKHKNDDFLRKLHDDRTKKGCEFAVLVSLLEADSELYNNGIVNKSHLYPKMYVIRPQFFVPFINLLVQASRKSLDYRRQLLLAQSKEVDVTNFEAKLETFKDKFGRHYAQAGKKFEDAIAQIDATIKKLQQVKDNLLGSENNLRLAQKDTEELTIRKLTYKNPTMKSKFDEARRQSGSVTLEDD